MPTSWGYYTGIVWMPLKIPLPLVCAVMYTHGDYQSGNIHQVTVGSMYRNGGKESKMKIIGYTFLASNGAVSLLFSLYFLHETGAPLWGWAIAGGTACFVGGWTLVAQELDK